MRILFNVPGKRPLVAAEITSIAMDDDNDKVFFMTNEGECYESDRSVDIDKFQEDIYKLLHQGCLYLPTYDYGYFEEAGND